MNESFFFYFYDEVDDDGKLKNYFRADVIFR